MNDNETPEKGFSGLPSVVEAAIRSALAGAGRRVVVFDADGTLWAGDLGERHLAELSAGGETPACRGIFQLYQDAVAQDVGRGYRLGVELLQRLTWPELHGSCARAWNGHRAQLFPFVRPALALIGRLGGEVWVVSASHRWIIERAVADLGIPAERVIAGATDCGAEGPVGDAHEPFPNGPGKAETIRARIGVDPVLGFGNSRHDFAMLAICGGAVVVMDPDSPSTELSDAAEARGWDLLSP